MKKKNQDKRSARQTLSILILLIVLGIIIIGLWTAFNHLRSLWLEQCVLTDVNAQVEIETGRRIKPDTVRAMFGLTNNANLAEIDFATLRERNLKAFPVIKSIEISRKLPDGINIRIVERDPFARLNLAKARQDSGLVCDDEGVVFVCRRGAEMLPTIRETSAAAAKSGDRIDGRSRAALAVLKAARDPAYANLNILEVDTTRPDFLTLTLSNYTFVKFCWEGMDDPSPATDAALRSQLTKVAQVIATNLQPETRIWNATQPGIIAADLNGRK